MVGGHTITLSLFPLNVMSTVVKDPLPVNPMPFKPKNRYPYKNTDEEQKSGFPAILSAMFLINVTKSMARLFQPACMVVYYIYIYQINLGIHGLHGLTSPKPECWYCTYANHGYVSFVCFKHVT